MTAAHGGFFHHAVAMFMTTFLVSYFLRYIKKYPFWIVGAIVTVFVLVESSFFVANAVKLLKRLFFLVFEIGLITTMYVWYNARKVTLRLLIFTDIRPYLPQLVKLSQDLSVPEYSLHLVYLTRASPHEIEKRIIDSIFDHPPKRAGIYWLVNIEQTGRTLYFGVYCRFVGAGKGHPGEFPVGLPGTAAGGGHVAEGGGGVGGLRGDLTMAGSPKGFPFVILQRFLSYDNEFSAKEGFILNSYFSILRLARSDSRAYGIDGDQAVIEKVKPLVITPVSKITLRRVSRRLPE